MRGETSNTIGTKYLCVDVTGRSHYWMDHITKSKCIYRQTSWLSLTDVIAGKENIKKKKTVGKVWWKTVCHRQLLKDDRNPS